jgi:hypothetical protein
MKPATINPIRMLRATVPCVAALSAASTAALFLVLEALKSVWRRAVHAGATSNALTLS